MKKFSIICLSVLMLIMLASCTSGNPGENTESGIENSENASLSADDVITILENGASEYAVVRSDYAKGTQLEAAVALRNAFEENVGYTITITSDWYKKGTDPVLPEYEILVGDTNRPESEAALEGLEGVEYVIAVIGNKVVINGTSDYAILTGVETFISQYLTSSTIKLPRDLRQTGPVVIDRAGKVYNIPTAKMDTFGFWHHDIVRLIVSLQGLYNRDFEETDSLLHLTYNSDDTFWYNYISGEGMFLENHEMVDLNTFDEFWSIFGEIITEHGMVLWDGDVPATANVAGTICGVDGYLPVRYDTAEKSLYNTLLSRGVEVKMSLVDMFTGEGKIPDTDIDSTGSTKNDAYIWAAEKYLEKTSKDYIAYTLDAAGCVSGNFIYETSKATQGVDAFWNSLYNHDYYVMKGMFFFDLTINATEAPCDDPDQPKGTDRETCEYLMKKYYEHRGGELAQLIGFPPWWMKYTTHHDLGNIVATTLEWDFTDFITRYNLIKEADAAMPCCMTNASVYNKFPLEEKYESAAKKAWNESEEHEVYDKYTRYFTIYMGDYDSSAWFKDLVPGFWDDSARGTLPIAWGFNPNLCERAPMVWDYVMKNQSENDFFMSGDSGAGYVIPTSLVNDKLRDYPSAADQWVSYCQKYFNLFDLDITGFIINGNYAIDNDVFEMYNEISPVGSFHNTSMKRLVIYKGVPYLHMMNGISKTPEQSTYEAMYNYAQHRVNFAIYRTVQQNPTDMKKTVEGYLEYANERDKKFTYKYVDPYTLFDLIRQSGQGSKVKAD